MKFARLQSYPSLLYLLPASVDSNKADAVFDKGALTVTLPKKEASKPRRSRPSIRVKLRALRRRRPSLKRPRQLKSRLVSDPQCASLKGL
jgi:hypothetical protein